MGQTLHGTLNDAMDGTPRLRSAFPSTPRSDRKTPNGFASPAKANGSATGSATGSVATAEPPPEASSPLVPFHIIDAPTQRFYVLAFYMALNAWRLWDYSKLLRDDAESLWLFLKWTSIDAVFIYGLPGLRVPWLEWSNATTTVLFLAHALLDGFLMFRIPIPIESWLIALTKILYDRELSVSERRVKPADILHNSSLILGKQTIHILPEGSAMLNPDRTSFCLDASRTSATLPIRINQTSPILIEILRIDLDTNQNETISISAKQARVMKKQADRGHARDDVNTPRFLQLPVKQTGLYRLQKVVDESKLEVQRRMSDTLVVSCPRAAVKSASPTKCRGELSDFALEVYGTPPLKIKYSRAINYEDRGFSFQSIQPENLVSPLARQRTSGALVSTDNVDVSWARPERILVPLNESLNTAGSWVYSIDEVHDASGNFANYTHLHDDDERFGKKASHLEQFFSVHERPRASIDTHTHASQCSLKVARGKATNFPISIDPRGPVDTDAPYTLTWVFTPLDQLQPNGEHAVDASIHEMTLKSQRLQPAIQQPGLYTLRSITNAHCAGEVLEPSTCLLVNPPEPDLAISAEKIFDKCAGNSIGLRVDLDLTGTPPFTVHYDILHKDSGRAQAHMVRIESLRHQLEFRPQEEGKYVYHFRAMDDDVYERHPLAAKNLVLEQDVKPSAHAFFARASPKKLACIEEPAQFDVRLQGEGPWDLEYELVHRGKRQKHKITGIEHDAFTIATDKLVNGGEYVMALVSVQDRSGCKIFLKEEAKIEVRQQRPKASFGQLEGKRSTLTLEGKQVILPLRLTGQPPWTLRYRNVDRPDTVYENKFHQKNDAIAVSDQGRYEVVDVQDAVCPGTVEANANTFDVRWIERPSIQVADASAVEPVGAALVKKDVCEGDEDAVEISLTGGCCMLSSYLADSTGTPPYHVKYEQRLKPDQGKPSLRSKEFTAGLGVASIRMETSQAGLYEYNFAELGDYLYDHDSRRHSAMVVQQRVHAKPSARFATPGKTFKYCKEETAGDEVIPIELQGTPPFHLEIGIKHHSSARPEVVQVPNINRNHYDFRIPHRVLALGHHAVSVRNVRDARGCQRKTEFDAPRVQVVVADVPAISAMETRRDYCVGDRISYTLSGQPPFNVFYSFEGVERKATSTATNFRRIAERPGNFTITALTDAASDCRARMTLTKMIHPMPSVKISKGQETVVDIHEGGEAELLFEFGGTPPFEFTYTRSSYGGRGKKVEVLETKREVSHEHSLSLAASDEGTYEVVAIKDRYCAFSRQRGEGTGAKGGGRQKLLEL